MAGIEAGRSEEFIEFEKMATSLSQLNISKKTEKSSDWIVLEKVHGANFSFHITDDHVNVARRRAVLTDNENFFSHQEADFMKTYPSLMKELYADVVNMFPDLNVCQVSVWGELFGGRYVIDGQNQNQNRFKPVQTEIQYCGHIEWIAYDISYRVQDRPDVHEYLDYDVAMGLFEKHHIFYSKPLFRGPMNEALNWDLNFQSTLPKILGMTELPAGSNIAEGVVVKPLKNLKCKDKYDEEVRIIVKKKSQQFMEVKDAGPHKNKKQQQKQGPKLIGKIQAYATEQRLTNAISKHGFPESREVEDRVVEEFVKDVLVDIKDDEQLNQEYDNATEAERNKIRSALGSKAAGLIKKLKSKR